MIRWLRYHEYALRVALRRLHSYPVSSLANIVVIALTLAVPIIGAAVLGSSEPLARQMSVAPELTLFIKADTPQAEQRALLDRIRAGADQAIASARLLPPRPGVQITPSRADLGAGLGRPAG